VTKIKIDSTKQVSVPEEESCLMVDVDDWARIRQNVARLGDPIVDWAGLWASIAAGAALALIAVVVSINTSPKDPHQELITALKVSIAFSVLFAITFGAVGLRERRRQSVTAKGVCDDMDGVAGRLGHPGLGVVSEPARPGLKGRARRIWEGDGYGSVGIQVAPDERGDLIP
jgi:hypothetical protein